MSSSTPEQQHPLWKTDRAIVSTLGQGEPTDYKLVELARLKIRYQGFPGARDIQHDLAQIQERWGLSDQDLFTKTQMIHASGQIYRSQNTDQEDWS